MLIVISIMLILVSLTATMIHPDVEGRRVREAARAINVYLASARNRAMETGRPCGVTFRNFGTPGFAMNADQCEVPPSYAGETEQSYTRVMVQDFVGNDYIAAELSDVLTTGMVRPGDLIQFNCQGPMYRLIDQDGTLPDNNVDDNGYVITDATNRTIYAVAADAGQNQLVPWPDSGWSQPVPYRIFRAPIKGFATPLQLPAATVVDLAASGVGDSFVGAVNYTVMFSPNGAVESVNGAPVVDPIFLLVGKRERMENGYSDGNPNESTLTNYQDLGNLWVTINPQTGAVQTEPVAAIPSGISDPKDAIDAARRLAHQGLGMGGK